MNLCVLFVLCVQHCVFSDFFGVFSVPTPTDVCHADSFSRCSCMDRWLGGRTDGCVNGRMDGLRESETEVAAYVCMSLSRLIAFSYEYSSCHL